MSEDHLISERKAKIAEWERLGFTGYAKSFDRTHTSAAATAVVESENLRETKEVMAGVIDQASLCGRIMNLRDMGKLAFLKIRDGAGDFQICLSAQIIGDEYKAWIKALDLGDFVGFKGEFFLTKHGEPTLMASSITPLSKALRPLPEKWHGLTDTEACYRERNLDLISNPDTLARFRTRSAVVREIRHFYEDLGFLEIETATLEAQAGGAMARTFHTHHNALDHEFVLRIAMELPHKIVCSGGIERLFEIGKCFRNEGSDPSHLQEFTMIEWYAAYADIEDNKAWTESMLKQICNNVLGTTQVTVLDKDDKPQVIDFGKPFAEVRFPDLLVEHAGLDMMKASDEEVIDKAKEVGVEHIDGVGRANLLDDIYKKTARPKLIQPTFVLDYPEDLKPLAAPNGDGTASCFQLLIAGWEIVNAYGELIDPQVQRELLERQSSAKAAGDDEAMEIDERFLKAMEHGFPPMTGFGMGIDRLVALLTAQPNLRDVVLFPTMRPESSDQPITEQPKKAKTITATSSGSLPDENDYRFVAVLNKKVETGRLMNALGHITAGLAGAAGISEDMCFLEYQDADGGLHPYISHFPFIALKADNSNKIGTTRNKAIEAGIPFNDFTSTMTVGTSEDQQQATKDSPEADLEYFGIVLFGKTEELKKITGKFSLYQ